MVIGSSDHQVATLVRRDGFDASEVDALTSWADGAGFQIHHARTGAKPLGEAGDLDFRHRQGRENFIRRVRGRAAETV